MLRKALVSLGDGEMRPMGGGGGGGGGVGVKEGVRKQEEEAAPVEQRGVARRIMGGACCFSVQRFLKVAETFDTLKRLCTERGGPLARTCKQLETAKLC